MKKQYIRNYIYLDRSNIDMVYNQFVCNQRIEKTISTYTVDGKICANVGTGNMIKQVFDSSIDATIDGGIAIEEERSHILTHENKVNEILEGLYRNQVENLSDYISKDPIQSDKMFTCKSVFSLDGVYDVDKGTQVTPTEIINNPFLYSNVSYYFSSTPQTIYDTDDNFIIPNSAINNDYRVLMSIDGKYMCRSVRHITNKLKLKANFIFYIWGELSYDGIDDRVKLYSIKPFAIWRLTSHNM